ncbi:MAG: LAGLIDADG family homing endonuclease, partial [Nanoarchaeota archaeon]
GQEWREFDSDQADKRRRTGAPMTYSVDYNEPIVVKNDNKVQIIKIGKFVDNLISENNSFLKKEGNIEYVPTEGLECVAFDRDYDVKFRKISEVSRHPVEEMYEILLETGKKVQVTGNHSVFTVKNKEIVSAKVDELKEGQFIVAPKEIPLVEEVKEISILDEFIVLGKKYPLLYLRNFSDNKLFDKLKSLEKENEVLKGRVKNWKRHNTLPLWVLNEFSREINIYDYNLEDCKIGIYSGRSELPLKIEVNRSLMKLLGFFTAEGTVGQNNLVFSFGTHEYDYIKAVISMMNKIFGIKSSVYQKETSATQIEFKSKLLSILFKDVLKTGSNAKTKRIPELIYAVSPELKKEYIINYINGDGSKIITGHEGFRPEVCISTNSVSEDLTNDFVTLYSQLGIHVNCQEALVKGHIIKKTGQFVKDTISRRAYIKNPDVAFELGFLSEKPHKNLGKGAIENFIPAPIEYRKEWKSRERIRIERELGLEIAKKFNDNKLLKLAQAPFLYLRIREVKKIKPSTKYAYDLTVPGYENFVGGRGGIFLHNTKFDRGLGTDIGQKGDI